MGQTKEGAQKTRDKNLANDPNFYKRIGSIGGKNSSGYDFAHGRVDPAEAGKKGGSISKRTKVIKEEV